MSFQNIIRRIFSCNLRKSVLPRVFSLLLLCALGIQASSPLDGYTPSALTPGSPAGVYPLSGFENINHFNGNLNFNLQLGQIIGRGAAQWPIYYNLELTHWFVEVTAVPYNCTPTEICYDYFYYPNPYAWVGTNGPSDLYARHVAARYDPGCQGGNDTANTRLTFRSPDGTEFELVDQVVGGVQQTKFYAGCSPYSQPPFNRGRNFVTTDGAAATFVSDADITDRYSSPSISYPSGYLYLRDGTSYRIESGWISWLRDRNGNKLTFDRSAGLVITDSLNRQVTYSSSITNGIGYRAVTFTGFGGAPRTIKLHYGDPQDENVMLRKDFRSSQGGTGFQTYQQLFPGLNGSYSGTYHFSQVTSIELPDQRFYRLYYSPYGNLARVELPTGGAIEYDIQVDAPGNEVLTQRITERRTYLSSGVGAPVINKTTFTNGVRTYDGSNVLQSTENHYFHGSPSMQFDPFAYNPWDMGKEYQTEWLASDGTTVLRRVNHNWQQGCGPGGLNTHPRPNNPRITETSSTLVDTSEVSKQTFSYDCYNNKTDVEEYDYGPGIAGGLVRRTHTDFVTSTTYTDAPVHLRSLPSVTQVFDAGGTKRAEAMFEYDDYSGATGHAALVNRAGISGLDSGFTTSYTTRGNVTKASQWRNTDSAYLSAYSQYDIAGNVVKMIDANSNATDLDYRDNFGAPTDGAVQSGGNPSNTAPSLLGGLSAFAFPFKVTNAAGHVAYSKYDYYLARPVLTEDPNNIKSSAYFNDALDRPTKGISALGTGDATQTVIVYNDTNGVVNGNAAHSINTFSDKTTFQESDSGNGLKATALYDGLGRTWRAASYDGSNWLVKETQFDALGRAYRASNPFSGASVTAALPGNPQWTTSTFDALSRATQTMTADGSAVTTAYSGNQVTVTDQAGKTRRSFTNALGHLTSVVEDPSGLNYTTAYQYDALNNLVKVTQDTQPARFFMYDSLSRLIRSKNVEQVNNGSIALSDPLTNNSAWTMAYSYDSNGNLLTRTDANNLATTYYYDVLNRNIYIRYSAYPFGTAGVDFVYDLATNGKGRLNYTLSYNARWDSDNRPYWHADVISDYDALGRPTNKWQGFILSNASNEATTWQQYNLSRTYNLAGAVTAETYPSGRTASYGYDGAGRTNSFTGNLGDGVARNYATEISYNAASLPTYEVFGAGTTLYHKRKYNSRHQLYDVRLSNVPGTDDSWTHGNLQFFYGNEAIESASNNGNVVRADSWAQKTDGSGAWTAQYDRYYYDGLNRLYRLYESGNNSDNTTDTFQFQQQFTFDQWGNRSIDVGNTTPSVPGLTRESCVIDTATNRMTQRNGATLTYDFNGNQNNDSGAQRFYEAENRLSKAGSDNYYYYDASGRRARRVVGAQETWQVYGFAGELVAEYNLAGAFTGTNAPAAASPTKEYGYRNGQMLVAWDETESDANQKFKWLVSDHLGSTRMEVGGNGAVATLRRHDYAPFGEELQGGQRATAGFGYTTAGVKKKFGSYERDNETGLDFAQARYYANVQGRFTGVDPFNPIFDTQGTAFIEWISEPQRWNKYSYALNNPLRYTDENGENPLDDLKRGSRAIATLTAKIAQRSGGRITNPVVMVAEALHLAMDLAFPSIVVETKGLQYAHEAAGAKLAAAFEGKSFLATGVNAPGVDGLLYSGPLSANMGYEAVQLQNNGTSKNVLGNIVRDADAHEGSVMNAGAKNVHLFVTVTDPNTTTAQVLGRLQADARAGTGIVQMTTKPHIPKVTILTNDGAVRVQNGNIYSCDANGRCSGN